MQCKEPLHLYVNVYESGVFSQSSVSVVEKPKWPQDNSLKAFWLEADVFTCLLSSDRLILLWRK